MLAGRSKLLGTAVYSAKPAGHCQTADDGGASELDSMLAFVVAVAVSPAVAVAECGTQLAVAYADKGEYNDTMTAVAPVAGFAQDFVETVAGPNLDHRLLVHDYEKAAYAAVGFHGETRPVRKKQQSTMPPNPCSAAAALELDNEGALAVVAVAVAHEEMKLAQHMCLGCFVRFPVIETYTGRGKSEPYHQWYGFPLHVTTLVCQLADVLQAAADRFVDRYQQAEAKSAVC